MTTTATPPLAPAVRAVLDAPRGRRFTHTPAPRAATPREQHMLAQMRDNPRVAHRMQHGELPAWMHTPPQRPTTTTARQRPPATPTPQPRHRRPPRRRTSRAQRLRALTHSTLAAITGALTHHVVTALL